MCFSVNKQRRIYIYNDMCKRKEAKSKKVKKVRKIIPLLSYELSSSLMHTHRALMGHSLANKHKNQ